MEPPSHAVLGQLLASADDAGHAEHAEHADTPGPLAAVFVVPVATLVAQLVKSFRTKQTTFSHCARSSKKQPKTPGADAAKFWDPEVPSFMNMGNYGIAFGPFTMPVVPGFEAGTGAGGDFGQLLNFEIA